MEERELKKIVDIVLKDPRAIQNWESICEALNLQSALFETFVRERPIPVVFKRILEHWKSENGENATKANLETALRNKKFNSIADDIKKMNNSGLFDDYKIMDKPGPSVGFIKSPLTLNYEGVVANYVQRNGFEKQIIAYLTEQKIRDESIDFPVVVLHGIGGVGKTTLARRICQLIKDSNQKEEDLKYFEQNCIWIHAQKEELVIKDFSKILEIRGKDQESIKKTFTEFYTHQLNNKPCLIVFDNVDDYGMILPYLPLNLSTKVSLLITSNVEWESGDLGEVKNIKIDYFTKTEFATFVRKIIQKISNKEIEYLDKYTGRIPYLANIACRGFSKWRKHHLNEQIENYFQDNDEYILGGINSGPSFTKYVKTPQEIVERQIQLMMKHEENDGELAYELLLYLAFCTPDFPKSLLLKFQLTSVDVSISMLLEYGFLKEDYEENDEENEEEDEEDDEEDEEEDEKEIYLSIHRSYQKAIRIIFCHVSKKEELFEKMLGVVNDDIFFGRYWYLALLWETGMKFGDQIIEKMIHNNGIMDWITPTWIYAENNAFKTFVEYLKRTKSKNESIQLFLLSKDTPFFSGSEELKSHLDINYKDLIILLKDLSSFTGELRTKYLYKLVIYVAAVKQEWLERIYESLPEDFKEKEGTTSFLHHAVEESGLEAVKFFIAKGFNVNARDKHGFTPLHLARTFEIAEQLLKSGADPNIQQIKINLETPLHEAARRGDKEIVELLLSYKADPGIKNEHGLPALDAATKMYEIKMVFQLSSLKQLRYEEIFKLLKAASLPTKRQISDDEEERIKKKIKLNSISNPLDPTINSYDLFM